MVFARNEQNFNAFCSPASLYFLSGWNKSNVEMSGTGAINQAALVHVTL